MIMRQCTNDYKIQPIKKKIRQLCNVGYKKDFLKISMLNNGLAFLKMK